MQEPSGNLQNHCELSQPESTSEDTPEPDDTGGHTPAACDVSLGAYGMASTDRDLPRQFSEPKTSSGKGSKRKTDTRLPESARRMAMAVKVEPPAMSQDRAVLKAKLAQRREKSKPSTRSCKEISTVRTELGLRSKKREDWVSQAPLRRVAAVVDVEKVYKQPVCCQHAKL